MNKKILSVFFKVMIAASVVVLLYCLFFYLDYSVILKYTVNNGFSKENIIYPKDKREMEINNLLILAKALIVYAGFAILGFIFALRRIKTKTS